jgi:hypothetical protein
VKPIYWIIAIVLGAGGVAAWQYSQQVGEAAPVADTPPAAMTPSVNAAIPSAVSTTLAVATPTAAGQPQATPASEVTQWIRDTQNTDADARAAAITALAVAPRDRSLPVLERLVMNADPADRPLALKSLQQLALEQGDTDNRIRSAIRDVIYHGDDEQLAAGAQAALDSVEVAEQEKKKRGS